MQEALFSTLQKHFPSKVSCRLKNKLKLFCFYSQNQQKKKQRLEMDKEDE